MNNKHCGKPRVRVVGKEQGVVGVNATYEGFERDALGVHGTRGENLWYFDVTNVILVHFESYLMLKPTMGLNRPSRGQKIQQQGEAKGRKEGPNPLSTRTVDRPNA